LVTRQPVIFQNLAILLIDRCEQSNLPTTPKMQTSTPGERYPPVIKRGHGKIPINCGINENITYPLVNIQKTMENLPSGKHTKNYGKSPLFIGTITINGDFP
jgi:hypothetical protein